MRPRDSPQARRNQQLIHDIDEFINKELVCVKDGRSYYPDAKAKPMRYSAQNELFEQLHGEGEVFTAYRDKFHELYEVKAVLLANSVHISERSTAAAQRLYERALRNLFDALAGGRYVSKSDIEAFVATHADYNPSLLVDLQYFSRDLSRKKATFAVFLDWFGRERRMWIYDFM